VVAALDPEDIVAAMLAAPAADMLVQALEKP
jgi:hypothetical protein